MDPHFVTFLTHFVSGYIVTQCVGGTKSALTMLPNLCNVSSQGNNEIKFAYRDETLILNDRLTGLKKTPS